MPEKTVFSEGELTFSINRNNSLRNKVDALEYQTKNSIDC